MKVFQTVLVVVLSLVMAGGCAYKGKVDKAAASFQKAQALGAEQKAPYEYYAAKAYLDLARHEVKDYDGEQAGIFAEKASSFAEQAIGKSGGAK